MILVTGCTGYIGRRLCKQLLMSGFQVGGIILPSEKDKAKSLIDMGLIPYYGDLTDWNRPPKFSKNISFIYHLAGIHSTYNNTYDLYVQGTANLLQSFPETQKTKIVVVSNSSVYANADSIHSEGVTLAPHNIFGQITLQMENVIKKCGRSYAILRVGEVYGDCEANPFHCIQNGITLIGNGMNYSSKIFIQDLLNILIVYIEQFHEGIFNVCDNEPVRQLEFYRYAEKLSRTKLVSLKQNIELNERIMLSIHGLRTLNIIMTNQKIKDQLGYQFVFPTFRDGLQYLYEKNFSKLVE